VVSRDEIDRVFGTDVYDMDGGKIGAAGQVYVDDESGEPAWVTVRTGLFGTRESFVPLGPADFGERGLTVPYTKAFVKDAPNHDADGHLTPEDEQDLYAYYGTGDGDEGHLTDSRSESRHDDDGPVPAPVGESREDDHRRADTSKDEPTATNAIHDRSGPTAESESRQDRIATEGEGREASRLRLRKVVVTENVTVTVPVQREELRVEQEPEAGGDHRDDHIDLDDPGTTGADRGHRPRARRRR
jgi:hypothetical protein